MGESSKIVQKEFDKQAKAETAKPNDQPVFDNDEQFHFSISLLHNYSSTLGRKYSFFELTKGYLLNPSILFCTQ